MNIQNYYLIVPFAPLLGAIIAGLFGRMLGRTATHRIVIALVGLSLFSAIRIFQDVMAGHLFNGPI